MWQLGWSFRNERGQSGRVEQERRNGHQTALNYRARVCPSSLKLRAVSSEGVFVVAYERKAAFTDFPSRLLPLERRLIAPSTFADGTVAMQIRILAYALSDNVATMTEGSSRSCCR
jgi:hypothetical protein